MVNYGSIAFRVLGFTLLCLFIGTNSSSFRKEVRTVHKNIEFRLNGFQNELIKALVEIAEIQENRGECTCPAPNQPITDSNLEQTDNKKEKDEIGDQIFRTYIERVTRGFEDEKSARKQFEKKILNLVKVHTKSQEPGIWTTWSNWGMCSVSCGIGLQRRTRTCTQSTPELHMYPCVGDASEYEVCLIGACADGSWSAWGSWGSCSTTCNAGMRNRHRSCNNPAPSLLGKTCIGNSVMTKICNNNNCPNPMVYFAANTPNSKLATTNNRPLFTRVVSNHGGGYNKETAIFTAPVKGLYLFSLTFLQRSTSISALQSHVHCNLYHNSNVFTYAASGSSDGEMASTSVSVFLYLDIGDTVDVRGCSQWQHVHTGFGSIFTGALVMP